MNKNFFDLNVKLTISDILLILKVSNIEFLKINKNYNSTILNTYITDIVSFSKLSEGKLSFLSSKTMISNNTKSGICIIKTDHINLLNNNIIKIPFDIPRMGFSMVLNSFFNPHFSSKKDHVIHSTAIISKKAILGKNVNIGPYCIIEDNVVIEDNTYISDRVTICKNCSIGEGSIIYTGVYIECSIIQEKVVIYPNTVIGKIGFGFIPNKSKTSYIPHIGAVQICSSSTIGSGCTIDRGAIDDTYIGNSVMIDNQVHIGHNCFIDDYCIIAGKVGLSGSVILEKNVSVGGDVSIKDNITIGENTIIYGASKVFNNFPKNSKIAGNPAQNIREWKRLIISQKLNLKKRKNI